MPKSFAIRRQDGRGGYTWGLGDIAPVLYRLPELINPETDWQPVFIPEGEEDVDRVRALGLKATCNFDGAAAAGQRSKWRSEYNHHFSGRNVYVLTDNDEAGHVHGETIAGNLYQVAKTVKVVNLPDLPPKGDVSDWLDAGHTKAELERECLMTPIWQPSRLSSVGDRVNVGIDGLLETIEPAEIAKVLSPVSGQWGNASTMPNGSGGLNAEINLEPAAAEYFTAQAANGSSPAVGNLPTSSLPRPMSELLAHRFKPQEYLVDRLLAKGHLGSLGGRPKSGKSWIGLQLAMSIDTGTEFLGRETLKSKVLYYALEDGDRRVQARAKALGWQPQNAAVLFTIPNLDDGQGGYGPGVEEIARYLADFDLIIIDTLIAAMSGKTDERDNSAMGRLINDLARLAHRSDKAILIVHHTGKAANPDDIFATLRGASAIRGAYDVGLILERKPGEREAILHTESRDLDVRNMTLRQADNGAGWKYVGDAHELEKIRAGRKVLDAMLENDASGEGLTAKQLAEIRKVSEATIHNQLKRLEADGYICRDEQPSTQMGKRPDIWRVKAEFR